MMTLPDLTGALIETTLAISAAIVLVLLLRLPLRAIGGWRAVYALWALVPAAWFAVLLPAPVRYVAEASVQLSQATAVMSPAGVHLSEAAFDPAPILLVVWAVGALACVFLFVRRQRHFIRGLGTLRWCAGNVLQAEASVGLPAVIGLLPKIVLPADFETRYRADEQMLILTHERIHARRGDLLSNALLVMFRCLYWFNPLLFFAAARFRRDQELACDEVVIVRYPQARRAYGEAMLKTQLSAFPAPVACHWFGSHPLKERVTMLKHPTPSSHRWFAGLAVAILMTASVTFVAWAAQPPDLVTQAGQADTQTGAASSDELLLTSGQEKVSLRVVALELAAQAKLRVVNPEVLNEGPISYEFKGIPVDTAFALIGEEAGYHARISNGEVRFVPMDVPSVDPGTPQAAPGAAMIDMRMKLNFAGKESSPRVLIASGDGFLIRQGTPRGDDRSGVTTVDGVATLLADGKIEIVTEIRRGDKLLGKPRLQVADGKPGSIEIDGEDGSSYRLEIDASAKPERYRDVKAPPRAS